jgi:hypothetical protein
MKILIVFFHKVITVSLSIVVYFLVKSIEEREEEYRKARARIFSDDTEKKSATDVSEKYIHLVYSFSIFI